MVLLLNCRANKCVLSISYSEWMAHSVNEFTSTLEFPTNVIHGG